jgi:hypothetical protein
VVLFSRCVRHAARRPRLWARCQSVFSKARRPSSNPIRGAAPGRFSGVVSDQIRLVVNSVSDSRRQLTAVNPRWRMSTKPARLHLQMTRPSMTVRESCIPVMQFPETRSRCWISFAFPDTFAGSW